MKKLLYVVLIAIIIGLSYLKYQASQEQKLVPPQPVAASPSPSAIVSPSPSAEVLIDDIIRATTKPSPTVKPIPSVSPAASPESAL